MWVCNMESINLPQLKVELVDHMGDDLSVVNAARVSFDKVSEWQVDEEDSKQAYYNMNYIPSSKVLKEGDVKLIKFLAKHNHWTPFGHTAISLRMAAPVPIRTQCFKHKIGLIENEESRRYIKSVPEIYIPTEFRSIPKGSIKQGSGDTHGDSQYWLTKYNEQVKASVFLYLTMIDAGICPEQARLALPQGAIVNWIWTGNLMSFANFFNKRIDNTAQKEIQALAIKVDEVISPLYPVSWAALTKR